MGYQLETTALISKDNYNAFRIRCIMLIVGKLNFITLLRHIFDLMFMSIHLLIVYLKAKSFVIWLFC